MSSNIFFRPLYGIGVVAFQRYAGVGRMWEMRIIKGERERKSEAFINPLWGSNESV